jgi:hypothetical protein
LVFTGGNDPAARGYHDGRGVALRSSSAGRLAHTSDRAAERTSTDVVGLAMTLALGVEAPLNFTVFPAAGRALLLAHSERFLLSVDNLLFRRRSTGQETARSIYQRRSEESRIPGGAGWF